jgi:hypothetical protein
MKHIIRKQPPAWNGVSIPWDVHAVYDSIDDMPEPERTYAYLLWAVEPLGVFGHRKLEGIGWLANWQSINDEFDYYLDMHAYEQEATCEKADD